MFMLSLMPVQWFVQCKSSMARELILRQCNVSAANLLTLRTYFKALWQQQVFLIKETERLAKKHPDVQGIVLIPTSISHSSHRPFARFSNW